MKTTARSRSRGASMTEFLIVAPVLLGLGGGTLQAALAYHGKSTLNYATFEAARTGATHHALEAPMRRELGIRLAPLHGGDGTAEAAIGAIIESSAQVATDPLLRLEIINPTREAFEAYRTLSRESGEEVIPNSHLRHQSTAIDSASGVSLHDANLLKIKVSYGLEMKVPVIRSIVAAVMPVLDPPNAQYYSAGRLPLVSVATLRMQSEVHGDSLVSKNRPPASGTDEALDETVALNDEPSAVPPGSVDAIDGATAAGGDSVHGGGSCNDDGSDPFLPTVDQLACEGSADTASAFANEPDAEASPAIGSTESC